MEEKKVPVEQAMEMSLEDYIKQSGIVAPELSHKHKSSYGRHNNEDGDEEDTMDYEDCPNPKSQQWRLLPPNKPTRPAGMPPLVPFEAEIRHKTLRSRSSIIREQKQALNRDPNLTIEVDVSDNKRNFNIPSLVSSESGIVHQTSLRSRSSIIREQNQALNRDPNLTIQLDVSDSNRNCSNNKNQNWNGHRKQFVNRRGNNRNLNDDRNRLGPIRKNQPTNSAASVHQRLNINRWDPNAVSLIRNGLTGETSTALERKVTTVLQNVVEKVANNTVAAVTSQLQLIQPINHLQIPLPVASTQPTMFGENYLKAYMKELAPQVVGGLLNQDNATKEQQKYDMDVQKTISQIQRKPLMYTSPGSSVISSDGRGLQCLAKPHSTGTSMNQRFA